MVTKLILKELSASKLSMLTMAMAQVEMEMEMEMEEWEVLEVMATSVLTNSM